MPHGIIDEYFEKFGLDKGVGDRKDQFQWTIFITIIEIDHRLIQLGEKVADLEEKVNKIIL